MAFNFGNTSKPGFSFGSTSTTKATGTVQPFSLGGSTTSSAPSTGFTFGSTTGSAASQPAKTTSSLFGTNTAASTGLSGSGFGSGFKLGGSAVATTKAVSGFSFGGGGSLGTAGSLTATSTTSSGLGTTSAVTAAPAFKGLGGVSSSTSASNPNDNGTRNNGVGQALKEQQVPDELCKDINDFEEFVKKQKGGSNTVGKFSVRSLRKIQEEVLSLSYALGTVSSALHRNNAAVQKLRSDFTEELQYIEMAKHTQDIPPSLQHDNIAPIKFFINMLSEFEASLQMYRKQIEELENHLSLTDQSANLTPQDIYIALCKMQETFITLAANLHSIHDQVKILKEQYLVYRRIVHSDTIDIFAQNRQKISKEKTPQKPIGLSPFNQLSNVAALAMASMVNQQRQQQQQQQGPPQQGFFSTQPTGGTGLFGSTAKPTGTASLFGGTSSTGGSKFGGFSGFGATTKPLSAGFGTSSTGLFGNTSALNTSAGLTFGGPATSGAAFELKRPPIGNKRGKNK